MLARAGTAPAAEASIGRVSALDSSREAARLERRQLGYAIAVVVGLHLLPRLVLGTHSYISVHDNLENDMLYRALIARDHRMFSSDAMVTELLGGLPRWDYPSALKVSSLLFWVLPPFSAYVVLEAFVRAMAVLGMGLLLRDYVPAARLHRLAVAATFGILPFYSIFDLSVAGEPLVAWALLNLWHQRRLKASLAVCAGFPFASVMWTGPPFFLALAGMCLCVAALRARRVPLHALGGLLLTALCYLVSDQQYLAGLLREEFISHRSAWHVSGGYSLADLARAALPVFVQGQYHAASLQTPILVATALLVPLLLRRGHRREAYVLFSIIVVSALLALSTQSSSLAAFDPIYVRLPALRQIHVRFWWSLPLLWYAALGVIALYWPKTGLRTRVLNGLLAFQLLWVFAMPSVGHHITAEPELSTNYLLLASAITGRRPAVVSYAEFVSKPAFDRIRQHIGADTGRVLTLGMHVAVAAYNGFDCVDGVHDNFPLSYKLRFRRLIAQELRHNKRNLEYFDSWGGRLYALLRGFPLKAYDPPQARPPRVVRKLELDEAALHDLQVKWIVSALELQGKALQPFLTDEGKFGDPQAGYVIYLYRVRD